ncbi:glutaredoxin family protein [bacterium]|nr:glutaredoxin family protein [bacterium]
MNLLRKKRLKVRVEIYSKPDCHLCDDAKALLNKARKSYPFEMIETDISEDDALFQEYKEQIPVVFINGRKAFKFKVDEDVFRKRLGKILDL